tara:strand:- start:441 stop:1181 length:741 start_codon:yes stop_codon:yes gene_type:complete
MNLEYKISNWLKEYLISSNLESFVIGVSGGIDSAVASTLCAMTGIKTYILIMPIHQKLDETNRGIEHYKWLKDRYNNVEKVQIELTEAYNEIKNAIPDSFHSKLSLANTRARIRMTTLYAIAGSSKGIVVGTGNKVEDFGVGFFTKYGDGGVDISPIADLMKSDVFNLGKKMGIINSILSASPTDGLWDDGRTDEDQLGVSYDELEWAMDNNNPSNKYEERILSTYKKHRKSNLHKMKRIPIFKVK